MSLQQLLFLVLFATLFQSSISNPVVARAKDDPDHWVEHYEKVFAGIYWKEAWETCSEREFFLLADTVSSVTEWIDPSQNGGVEDRDTPGWTRFFAGRSVSYSWTVSYLDLRLMIPLILMEILIFVAQKARLPESLREHHM
jgi:hypothetical protein